MADELPHSAKWRAQFADVISRIEQFDIPKAVADVKRARRKDLESMVGEFERKREQSLVFLRLVAGLGVEAMETRRKLKKHRKPKRNAARDAEIMRLHLAGQTAGQIAFALADRWKLTDRMVNAVISRERPKLK